MSGDDISLSKAIQDLRDELITAQAAGKDSSLHFNIEEITLDIEMVATRLTGGDVKIGWSLFGASGRAEDKDARTHRLQLKMKLAPKPDGTKHDIGATRALPAQDDIEK